MTLPKDWWTTDMENEPCDGCGARPSKHRGHGSFICKDCYEKQWCPACHYQLTRDHVCPTLEEHKDRARDHEAWFAKVGVPYPTTPCSFPGCDGKHGGPKMTKLADLDLLKFGNTIGMVGVVYAGEGRALLAVFPGEDYPDTVERFEMDLDDWQTLVRQTDLLETEVTARQGDGTVKKAIVRKSARVIEGGVQWRVWKRDHFRCRYCGAEDLPLTVDHVVCYEEGGPSTEANLLSADKRCNKTRGNTPYEEWLRHPYYLRVSARLDEETRQANVRLLETLDRIPRMNYIKSR